MMAVIPSCQGVFGDRQETQWGHRYDWFSCSKEGSWRELPDGAQVFMCEGCFGQLLRHYEPQNA